jgi:hypothetical protein
MNWAILAHERPYFMPSEEHERLHELILKEAWARADHAQLKKAASSGDGFAAAFLYALDGDSKDAAIAQQCLLASTVHLLVVKNDLAGLDGLLHRQRLHGARITGRSADLGA